jgi:carboxyl-terminal processing protease
MSSVFGRNLKLGMPVIVGILCAVQTLFLSCFLGVGEWLRWTEPLNPAERAKLEVCRFIDSRYIDQVEVPSTQGLSMDSLISLLDPHSAYIGPGELKAVEEDMRGSFEGIGVEFMLLNDTIFVLHTIVGGPAELAGVRSGDRIVSISDTMVSGIGIGQERIFRLLRGKSGTTVRIGVQRNSEKHLRQFIIKRGVIPVKSVESAYLIAPATGYVRVSRFSEKTHSEFIEAIGPLVERQKMRHLILDLRGNPGGYLHEATNLLSQFFPAGKLLVYTLSRSGARRTYKSSGRSRFNLDRIVVLIDEGSASASEIVAGAVQDHDRGWVLGRRSFGKGLVQEQYPLSDGGALRLTIARYYTPSGRCIQRTYEGGHRAYEDYHRTLLRSGVLLDSTRYKLSDSTRYFTGRGRVVYGGGGVMPDLFIPMDSNWMSPYVDEIRSTLSSSVLGWLELHRDWSGKMTIDQLAREIELPSDLIASVEVPLASKYTKAERDRCRYLVDNAVKAFLARHLFGLSGKNQVENYSDEVIARALAIIKAGKSVFD